MGITKQCPFCAEGIQEAALVCRHCHSDVASITKERNGSFVKVRVRVTGKLFSGDVFVPEYLNRLSDVINDARRFIILINTVEETGARELPIGFLAINKNQAEWIELEGGNEEAIFEGTCRIIEWR